MMRFFSELFNKKKETDYVSFDDGKGLNTRSRQASSIDKKAEESKGVSVSESAPLLPR